MSKTFDYDRGEEGPPCRVCRRSLPKYNYGRESEGLHSGICLKCSADEACSRGDHVFLPGQLSCFWCTEPHPSVKLNG